MALKMCLFVFYLVKVFTVGEESLDVIIKTENICDIDNETERRRLELMLTEELDIKSENSGMICKLELLLHKTLYHKMHIYK